MEAIFSALSSGAKFNKKKNASSLELFSRAAGTANVSMLYSAVVHLIAKCLRVMSDAACISYVFLCHMFL
jgi:hypothetical protein